MLNAPLQSLQIQPDSADPVLAQQQARFNALVRDVALWRAALAGWTQRIARYQQATDPARRELHAAWRQWVFALDHASLQPGLARAERAQLGELLRESIAALPEVEDDPEIAAVASRHEKGPPTVQSGHEDGTEAPSHEVPLGDPLPEWERQAAAAAAQRADRAARRRAGVVSKRTTQAAQDASQSLRDVYRRLASALHPDREQDPRQRGRKTQLMQEANRANADGNLLALLELQLQAGQLAAADRRRVQHYVTLLQEQLADLQSQTWRLEARFRAAAGVSPGWGCSRARRIGSSRRRSRACGLNCCSCAARPGCCWTWRP